MTKEPTSTRNQVLEEAASVVETFKGHQHYYDGKMHNAVAEAIRALKTPCDGVKEDVAQQLYDALDGQVGDYIAGLTDDHFEEAKGLAARLNKANNAIRSTLATFNGRTGE